jgi:NAD(P)-dependent dehydrogenase (short-subunit alcohol dehydrogenase family)
MRALDRILDATVVPGYTNVGFAIRCRWWQPLPSMEGRVVVITGATGGLGAAAAHRLAGLGARVVLVGRDAAKVEQVRAEIIAGAGNADVAVEVADLSLMREVRALGERLLEREARIHALINNVGVLYTSRQVTAEGIEASLATNLLGHFVLTSLLIPRLRESTPARIIEVSSGGMYTQRVRADDLQSEHGAYRGSAAYARTKRGQVILSELWDRQLAGTGVVAHSMHPGWVDTPGIRHSLPRFRAIMRPLLRSPEQGSDTIVWLAASPEAARAGGGFWMDRRQRTTHRLPGTRETPEERRKLWAELERLAEMVIGSSAA